MQRETATHTREYYGFVFSNDNTGDIFAEEEYNSVFDQIKSAFSLTTFYSLNSIVYDPMQDTSKGRSYAQLDGLFHNTKNYYIMSGICLEESSSETESVSETNNN